MLEQQHPKLIVSEMSKNLRTKKVFIDWSQNAGHKTTVGVYSLRAKGPRPFVSMPVRWDELTSACRKKNGDALYFKPDEALTRLAELGDLFAPVLKLKQKLPPQFVIAAPAKAARKRAPRSLAAYDAKRNFTRTAEPAPESPRRSRQGSRRRFVVQKHAASHLHYDFRLEMHDVLKSWAVPHGVPVEQDQVRSAFETEDHPIDYLEFEGVIPEGEYGGGTVMVWDIGTYEVVEGNYWKGFLSVFLTGKKLRGEWSIQRLDQSGGKTKWLLTKTSEPAKRIPAKKLDLSAITGRTLEQIAREKTATWHSNRSAPTPEATRPKKVTKAPEFIPPMKATAVETLPGGDGWIYEVKWDGYRALAIKHGDSVRLLSLKNRSLSADFPDVVKAVGGIGTDTAMIDGEVVAVNAEGRPSFQMLQNRGTLGRDWHIVYYAFDLLNLNGDDLRARPLIERKVKLRELLERSDVRYSAELTGDPAAIVESIQVPASKVSSPNGGIQNIRPARDRRIG
jgi:bifunctional non-homologous end joining protein LigD